VLTLASGQSEVWGLNTSDHCGEDRYPNREWFGFLEALMSVCPEVKACATQEVLLGFIECFVDYFLMNETSWSQGHRHQHPQLLLSECGG
jgi:hypothetical protein